MALTNALLKSMGIEQDQRDQIMAAHQETLESIKAERDELQDTAAKVPDLEKKVKELEDALPTEDWEAKHSALQSEFESYKAKVEEEKTLGEKKLLYEAIIRDAGISKDKIVSAILKDVDFDGVTVNDGAISDAEEIKKGIVEEWKEFIPTHKTEGAPVPTPPGEGGSGTGANPEVVKRLAERHARLYGAAPEKE